WEISVSSEKGKGTTFDVTIPLNLIEGGNVESTSSLTGYDITVLSRDKDYAELIERSLSYYRVNTKFVEIRDGNYQDIVSDTIILDLDRENKDFFLKMMEHCHVSNFIVCIKGIYSDLKEFFKTKENVKIIYNPIYPFDIYRYLYDINGDEQCEIENRLNDLTLDKGFSNIKALIVDDNYINQNIFKTMLGRLGIDSDLASDGRVALKKIEDTMYDIIFMDIQMPGQDGYEVTRLIRANERYKNIPIIAVTAHAFKEDVEKALNSGMNDHIAKPLKFDTLVKTISKWINLETKIVIPGEVKDNINIPYLDLKELSSRGLNFYDVKPLIEIFVYEVNKELSTVEKYLEDNNINELQKIIHKFKGTSGNLCLTDIYINLSKIDNKLKNNVEPKSIKNLFDIFFEQILVLRHFLLIENENGKNNEESFGEQELTVKDIEYIKELINKRNMTVIDEINKFINQLKRIDLELTENIIMDINNLNFKEAYEKLSIILEKINGEKR
ncbi:MAG: response regulator, partial [Deferribacterales bacterium]